MLYQFPLKFSTVVLQKKVENNKPQVQGHYFNIIQVLLSGVEPKTFRLLVRMLRTSNRKVLGSTPDRSTWIFFSEYACVTF